MDRGKLVEAQKLLAVLMLRRLKVDVEKGLPPKLETVVECPLAPQQVFWYRSLLLKEHGALGRVEAGNGPKGSYKSLMNLLMQLRKTCCHPFLFPDAEGDPDETTLAELVENATENRRLLIRTVFEPEIGYVLQAEAEGARPLPDTYVPTSAEIVESVLTVQDHGSMFPGMDDEALIV